MHIFVGNLAFTATEDDVPRHRPPAWVWLCRDAERPGGPGCDCRAERDRPWGADVKYRRGAPAGSAGWAPAWPPVVSGMSAPRRLLGGPARALPATDPLPGYLCEQCQDAPAVLLQPAPGGGERGVCTACSQQEERPGLACPACRCRREEG